MVNKGKVNAPYHPTSPSEHETEFANPYLVHKQSLARKIVAHVIMDSEATQSSAEWTQSGFPQSPSAFDSDARISFSKLDERFILETEEGTEFEWDGALRRWIPAVGIVPLSHHHHLEEAMPPLRTHS